LRGARSERGKLNEVAAVQRQIGNLLGGNHLAQGSVRSLNGYRRRRDLDAGLHGRWGELEIQFAMLVHLEPDILSRGGLEAWLFHLNVVIRHAEQGNNILASFIRGRGSSESNGGSRECHLRTRHSRSACVRHGP
jgi:hypothetical protein